MIVDCKRGAQRFEYTDKAFIMLQNVKLLKPKTMDTAASPFLHDVLMFRQEFLPKFVPCQCTEKSEMGHADHDIQKS